jgi:hypothetical protein
VSSTNFCVFSHWIPLWTHPRLLSQVSTASMLPTNPHALCTASPCPADCLSTPFQSQILEHILQAPGTHCGSRFGRGRSAMIVKLLLRCPAKMAISPLYLIQIIGIRQCLRAQNQWEFLPGPRNTQQSNISDSIHRTSSAGTTRSCFAS